MIHITFKDAKGESWSETKELIADAISEEFIRHRAAFDSEDCPEKWKRDFQAFQSETATQACLMRSLKILASALHLFYKERPVILIDEYDSPINHAAVNHFGQNALQFFRNFLSGALKDGRHCRLGVITGILRVAKEGVLSGLNNPKVYSVFDDAFSDCFGFTEEEVAGMLVTYRHPEKMSEARDWYDGYRFGSSEIYNPWSVLNYVDDGFKPRPFWTNTSSNDLVTDAISRMTPRRRDELADMFENGKQLVPCARELGPYGLIQDNAEIIWSLLVHTGYLKVLSGPDDNGDAVLAFPNRELRTVFKDDILGPIRRTPDAGENLRDMLRALTRGDAEAFRKSLEAFLMSSASYFDMAHEDFFHGLLLGLLAALGESYEIKSNREAGDGRPDIAMKPRPGVPLPGVILELKSPTLAADAPPEKIAAALEAAARAALDQIVEKHYAAEMEAELAERNLSTSQPFNLSTAQDAPQRVLRYGVGFLGKRVALAK